ncbi:amine oxidase [Rhizobium sp. Root708]|uniref:flavin monoamine oxidase family protein n=1 Tax=Rhizobium sp. Root708 TaxID=1736592 RepID=UPI0006F4B9F8|nr:FAD-dependent oxidoreductase [Rhizobium sp. Root708]KRB49126.1 amine oxidase [Rhizobium sp. Root708]
MATDVDIAIVGGGAAGIAAARRLAASGFSTIMLEASSRLGGRGWTQELAGFPLDLGCGWLHSADRNPWTGIAEQAGFAIDRREAAWGSQYANLGFSAEQQSAARRALNVWEQQLPRLVSRSDRAGDALLPGAEWNPYVHAICGFSNGVAPDRMSAADYLAYDAACSYRNWRVPAGYGTLISASLPSATNVRLATPVEVISEHRNGLAITTPTGTIHAAAAILTVSTNVLAGASIDLPSSLDPWRHAASVLPLGSDEKLFFQIDGETLFAPETHLIGDPYDTRTCDYYIRPFGWPVIECSLGGDSARIVAEEGLVAAFDLAIEQLIKLVGSGVRSKLRVLGASNWSRSDRIGGAYSCALPGHSQARQILSRSWEGRIFFAGEATHGHDFSTAHGAYDSGLRAADEAIEALRPQELRSLRG